MIKIKSKNKMMEKRLKLILIINKTKINRILKPFFKDMWKILKNLKIKNQLIINLTLLITISTVNIITKISISIPFIHPMSTIHL